MAFRGKEKVLEETILKIYNFSQSFPWPLEWLESRYDDYLVENEIEDTVDGAEIFKFFINLCREF